jgi:hypothetical protein
MKSVLALSLLAVLALPALPVTPSFPDSMDSFRAAIVSRLDEIAMMGTPPPEVSKEESALAKVNSSLLGYAGGDGKKELGLAAKNLGAAFKASSSMLVSDGANGLLASIDSLVTAARNAAITERDTLTSQANRDKIDAAIAKADAVVASAGSEEDWGGKARILAKAVAAFDKAKAAATKLVAKEAAAAAKNPTLTCQWSGVNFVADKGVSSAAWNSGTGGFGLTGQMGGATRYVLSFGATGVFGPGTYNLLGGAGGVTAIQGLVPVDNWLITGGSVTIDTISASSATGTFSFTALSGSTGAISVSNGVFSVPVAQ